MPISKFWSLPLKSSGGGYTPPPVGDSLFSMEGVESFNLSSPRLKNNIELTGEAKEVFDGIIWLNNNLSQHYVDAGHAGPYVTAASGTGTGNLYQYARTLAAMDNALAIMLRLTGYLGFLDEWVRIKNIQAHNFTTSFYNTGVNLDSRVAKVPHPYRKWLWMSTGDAYRGTDFHGLDNLRAHAPVAQMLYALRLNQGKTSPKGVYLPGTSSPNTVASTYGQVADYWEQYLRDWVKAWQGPQTEGLPGWEQYYKGSQHYVYNTSSSNQRPATGCWPIHSRHHTHTHVGASVLHYYLGKAIPEFSLASEVGVYGIEEYFINRNMYYWNNGGLKHGIFPRSMVLTGHSPNIYAEPSNYNGYIVMDMVGAWLEGILPNYSDDFGVPYARTVANYSLNGVPSNQGIRKDPANLSFGQTRATTRKGGAAVTLLDIQTGSGGEFTYTNEFESNGNFMYRSLVLCMPWEDSNTIENHVKARFTGGSYSQSGDYKARPRVMNPAIAYLMKLTGAKTWDDPYEDPNYSSIGGRRCS